MNDIFSEFERRKEQLRKQANPSSSSSPKTPLPAESSLQSKPNLDAKDSTTLQAPFHEKTEPTLLSEFQGETCNIRDFPKPLAEFCKEVFGVNKYADGIICLCYLSLSEENRFQMNRLQIMDEELRKKALKYEKADPFVGLSKQVQKTSMDVKEMKEDVDIYGDLLMQLFLAYQGIATLATNPADIFYKPDLVEKLYQRLQIQREKLEKEQAIKNGRKQMPN